MMNFVEYKHLILEEIARVWSQDGGGGGRHFNFTSMAVGSQQPLERRRYSYTVQEWRCVSSLGENVVLLEKIL